MDVELLEAVRAAVDTALVEGTTFATFQDELEPMLRREGWWGVREVVDPQTGETVTAQLGSPRRLRTIFDVNIRTAYARGRWKAIERVAEARPWLRYVGVLDQRIRPLHRAWHGTVLRWDDAWWQTHYPPNGWALPLHRPTALRRRPGELRLPDHGAGARRRHAPLDQPAHGRDGDGAQRDRSGLGTQCRAARSGGRSAGLSRRTARHPRRRPFRAPRGRRSTGTSRLISGERIGLNFPDDSRGLHRR